MMQKRITAKRFVLLLLLFSMLAQLAVLFPPMAQAAETSQTVYDNAGIFSSEELASLEETCAQYGAEHNVDIVILTENGLGGKSRSDYLEDFYAQSDYLSAVLLLINMDPNARGVQIQSYDDAYTYITDDTIDTMLKDIVPQLSDGDYYDAMLTYADEVAGYLPMQDNAAADGNSAVDGYDAEEQSDSSNPVVRWFAAAAAMDASAPFYLRTNFLLAIAALIAIIAVGIMAINAGGTVTTSSRTYIDKKNSQVVARRDRYIRTTVTRVKKQTNDNDHDASNSDSSHGDGGSDF